MPLVHNIFRVSQLVFSFFERGAGRYLSKKNFFSIFILTGKLIQQTGREKGQHT